jgi:hypothetical protein
MDWRAETLRVSALLLAASLLLLAPGTAGLGGSLALLGVYAGLAVALYALQEDLSAAPRTMGHDLGAYGATLWAAPVVAALVLLLRLGATPGEVQALGGLLGLAGMLNYFLRPVYHLLAAVARSAGTLIR